MLENVEQLPSLKYIKYVFTLIRFLRVVVFFPHGCGTAKVNCLEAVKTTHFINLQLASVLGVAVRPSGASAEARLGPWPVVLILPLFRTCSTALTSSDPRWICSHTKYLLCLWCARQCLYA